MQKVIDKPLMSITTASFNSERTIARTIESVLSQGYRPLQYVIMDGFSSDGTVGIARSYEEEFRTAGISYCVHSEPDGGMYEAINKAMDLCCGEVLGNVNSDDYYEPDALQKVMECYAENAFEVFQANLNVHTASGIVVKRAVPMGRWASTSRWNHPTLFLAGRAKELRYRTDNPYADFDLFLRALRAGCKTCYLDEPISNFTFGGMSTKKSISDVRRRISWKNQIFKDNRCSPIAYAEGAAVEFAKFLKA